MDQNIMPENNFQPVPKQRKQISSLIGLIIIIVFAVVLFGGAFAYLYFATKAQQPVVQVQQTQNQNNPTAGWKTYTSTSYGFEIKYPQSWEVLVNSSSDISFRDKKYDGSYEWPGLDMIWTPTSTDPLTNESKIFKAENAKNDTVIVYFTNDGKRPIFATCKLYLDPTVISTCNQMLSTFKFTTPVAEKGTNFNLKVATDLMNGYLSQYKLSSVVSNKRLIDYKINNIVVEKFDEINKCFFFTVDYSVQAATKQTDWVAGNGEEGINNWINNKIMFFNVIQEENNVYTIVGGGTGRGAGDCLIRTQSFTPFSLTI